MQEIPHRQHPTLVLNHNHYKWDSPLSKPKMMLQPPTYLTQMVSCWTHDQQKYPTETKTLSKKSNPVIQESNSGHKQMEGTKNTITLRPLKNHPLDFFK